MTDIKKLIEIMDNKCVSRKLLAERLGITRYGLDKKLNEGSDFKAWQMYVIKEVLSLSDEEAEAIFFAKDVGNEATKEE